MKLKILTNKLVTIPDFPKHKINESGEVFSYQRYPNGRKLALSKKGKTNVQVNLHDDDGKRHIKSVLYLLAEIFVPNPKNHPLIKYKGNLDSLHSSNIEWYSGSDEHETMEWRDIPNEEGYKISEYGHVLSYERFFPIVLKQLTRNKDGIKNIRLSFNDISCYRLIHELVGKTFIPNPNNYEHLIHIDGNVNNNHYSNLKWVISPFTDEDLEWRSIENFSRYIISEKGHVVSNICKVSVLISTVKRVSKHENMVLRDDYENMKYSYVHELVAKAFIPNPEKFEYVIHLDENRSNNYYKNLKWSPVPDNIIDDGLDWREIPDFPDYRISNTGLVKSYKGKFATLLSPQICETGYKSVNLYNNGEHESCHIHRLVASVFLENPEDKPFVDHIDRNKLNNNVSNLRWATPKENAENRDNLNKQAMKEILQIDENGEIIEIFPSAAEASRTLGITGKDQVASCARGEKETVGGFYWRYTDNVKMKPYKHQKGEIFKTVVGNFENISLNYPNYAISNYGNLIYTKTGLKKKMIYNVYWNYVLSHDGKSKHYRAHRLVALFFVEERTPERDIVNHKDENKLNPHYMNLEWVTTQENMIYSANRKRYEKVMKELNNMSLTIMFKVKKIK